MSDLLDIADDLVGRVGRLRFSAPVTHVYNPLVYAREVYAEYLRRYARPRPEVLMFGMNPGPWGMTQTGVPFGEIPAVRDWLDLSGRIRRPRREHPRVPILGFDCLRREISGQRLWGWARDAFGTPRRFFERFFVANYCPLVFLEASGRNRTPDKLPVGERTPLLACCDEALRRTVEALRPKYVIGIGGFAAARARRVLVQESRTGPDALTKPGDPPFSRQVAQSRDHQVIVGEILHPSPASPAANRGWREAIVAQLHELGIDVPKLAEHV